MVAKLLNILRQISEIIAKYDDYRSVLNRIVTILAESLSVDVCSVYVYSAATDELILHATHGLAQDAVGKVKMKSGEGLTGASFKQREILNVADPSSHPSFKFFEETGEEQFKSFLSVPLTVAGKCVGILVIQRVQKRRFAHAVIDMVKSLSTQLANLILNTQILQDLAVSVETPALPSEPAASQVMLRGISANEGIARGNAFVFDSRDCFDEILHGSCSDPEHEAELLEIAIKYTKEQTLGLERRALEMISEADASIFNVHLLFLEDQSLMDEIRKEVTEKAHSAEFSIKLIYKEYEKRFMRLNDRMFQERVMDLKDVMLRLLENIRAIKEGACKLDPQMGGFRNLVLVAEELLPSDLIRMPIDDISAVVCEKGGATAHVAILAKALNIPALLGVKGVTQKVLDNEEVIVDCHAELMYIRPSEQVIHHFEDLIKTGAKLDTEPDSSPAITTDGKEIILRGNISLICETSLLEQYGAKGVGLYRTEFLYMIRDYLPTEEDQYKVFSRILREAKGEEVTIRVLDTGGDKPLPYINIPREDNPALGYRGIRLLLAQRDLFKTHLRAILRAGVFGKLKILFPMITSSSEMIEVRQVLAEVETALHEEKVEHTEDYKVGIMLEVPSAVFGIKSLIKEVDYMSIGSNDLLQYTFAVDRGNELVADSFKPLHPVFLNLLHKIGRHFKFREDKTLAICGEMAGNVLATPFLLGAGVYELSMAPRLIPSIKRVVRAFSIGDCEALLKKAESMHNPESVVLLVREAFADRGLDVVG